MTKSFDREEGLKKLKDLVESIGVCMFITKNNDASHVRPMATARVDENADLWFFTKRSSPKIKELMTDEDVQLLYSHPGKDSYLNIIGKATMETSREKIAALWSPLVKAWFPEGVDDPELTLIKVDVDTAYYWDSGTNKMVSFFKMLTAAVTGTPVADGEEGNLVS